MESFKQKGITLISLVVSIIVIVILTGITVNSIIGEDGIIEEAKNTNLKNNFKDVESDIKRGFVNFQNEYYDIISSDNGVEITSIYKIANLQKYLNGKVNGFNYNTLTKETKVIYTNETGSYTVVIDSNGMATVKDGIYLSRNENLKGLRISTKDKFKLNSEVENIIWVSSTNNVDENLLLNGELKRKDKGVIILTAYDEHNNVVGTIVIQDDDETFGDVTNSNVTGSVEISLTDSGRIKGYIVSNSSVPGKKTLIIKGDGASTIAPTENPYSGYEDQIVEIIVEKGITCIDKLGLENLTSTKTLTLPSTLTKITDSLDDIEIETVNYNAKSISIAFSTYIPEPVPGYETLTPEPMIMISPFNSSLKYFNIGDDTEELPLGILNGTNVENVIIPEGITAIPSMAFMNCVKLKVVVFPESLKEIRSSAFANSSIETITIPENVKKINSMTFRGCTNLKSVTLNKNIEIIEKQAFIGCTNLQNIDFQNCKAELGERAFESCESLTNLYMGENITSIGELAFGWCENLKEVTIPEQCESLDRLAFYSCSKIETVNYNAIDLNYKALFKHEDGTSTISPMFLSSDTSIKNINFGEKVKYIYPFEFSYYAAIENINLPDSLIGIGQLAFSYCTSLLKVNIPKNVIYMSQEVFKYSKNIEEIKYDAIEAKYNYKYSEDDTSINPLFDSEKNVKIIIGNEVEAIDGAVFMNTMVEDIVIPASVENIYSYAFANCSYMKSLKIEGAPKISFGAFWGNVSLENLDLGNTYSIGKYAFVYGISLKNITIPESVQEIKLDAFIYCNNIQTINYNARNCIYEGDTDSGISGLFSYSSTAVTSLNIGSTVESIPTGIFASLKALTTVNFAEGVKKIDSYAFAFDSALTEIILPSTFVECGIYPFYSCSSLETIYIYKPIRELTINYGFSNLSIGAYWKDK